MNPRAVEKVGRQVTMADLAQGEGVSVMTVRRCMRGDPRQSAETREWIGALAARMGYRPNPLVRTLMAQVREKRVLRGTATVAPLANNCRWRGRVRGVARVSGGVDRAGRV